jgi:UDP-N-acetylglucosamine pyrophosphorylase
MCNQDNIDMISKYLDENDFFGLHEHSVHLFAQNPAPVLDLKGRAILRDKHHILQEANGNGYLLRAIGKEGIGPELKSRCISWVYVLGIDNVLAHQRHAENSGRRSAA